MDDRPSAALKVDDCASVGDPKFRLKKCSHVIVIQTQRSITEKTHVEALTLVGEGGIVW